MGPLASNHRVPPCHLKMRDSRGQVGREHGTTIFLMLTERCTFRMPSECQQLGNIMSSRPMLLITGISCFPHLYPEESHRLRIYVRVIKKDSLQPKSGPAIHVPSYRTRLRAHRPRFFYCLKKRPPFSNLHTLLSATLKISTFHQHNTPMPTTC